MTIAVDVDGVLADFVGSVCSNFGFQYDSVTSDIRRHLPKDVSQNQYEDLVTSSDFVVDMKELDGAAELIGAMNEYDDYVVFTSPIDVPHGVATWKSGRTHWLMSRGIPEEKIVFMTPQQKTLLNVDMIVEDNEWTTKNWMEKQKRRSALLVARPWNSGRLTVQQCAKAVRFQKALRDGAF